MDNRERVRQLQIEIKQLSEAISEYKKKRYRKPLDKCAQEMRGQRLKQILDELAQIANRKEPQQGRLGVPSANHGQAFPRGSQRWE
jgi:hypothetical protein